MNAFQAERLFIFLGLPEELRSAEALNRHIRAVLFGQRKRRVA